MKQFEGKSLEEVYELASNEFGCSITELDIDIIQQPAKGFLGIGKKSAVIEAIPKKSRRKDLRKHKEHKFRKKDIKIEEFSKRVEESHKKDEKAQQRKRSEERKKEQKLHSVPKVETKEKIFDNFYNEDNGRREVSKIIVKKDKDEILEEVNEGLISLFKDTCYGIDNIKVEFYDDNTLYIEFTGEDSALLIGKEGYRYKALSYILFNWINEKYGLMLRLEVAEFLKNQESAIHNYLEPIIEIIKEKGSFKTKPLDGILVHIALKKLREEFPEKYVAVKTNIRGDKYVLVNEYRSKEQ
ncbi:Jag N-terminal domain-containing protein [Halarcobacter anaerophilus]|jgi:spoIIIJ-associated protein|uniref:Protein jag n=1 Tax=Halarcobacter anaerophilus TaxID=877500 RepID=A0A4Q0XZB2_9BACT|nr:Jag N-terminal domain-containing protein [Halarcobacter anaerophilus]QDF29720.1 Jag domain-containing protein [Halarcobacter anaerophilus]RXJ62643.1 protein jag [Halarcobacter anaerophilus]